MILIQTYSEPSEANKFLVRFNMAISFQLQTDRLRLSIDEPNHSSDDGVMVEEERPKLKRPSLYQVIMLNDDYTPMEFVIHILESFFGMDREKATRVMLEVHTKGQAVCGVYSRDVAETKASQIVDYAQQNEHPLLCKIQAVDGE